MHKRKVTTPQKKVNQLTTKRKENERFKDALPKIMIFPYLYNG
jgi:hypothetical protein